ncbi:MAG TPA: D-alanine--D-alanine ligase family protein [Ktedonobacteraceae bacterium]|nr:D-alanine--D-alanine ligase family protein [Ktedonobacteraceae bacterium]
MTSTTRKLRVALIFGGRSCEHEVSLASALSVMAYLDPDKYEVLPIAISREGAWLPGIAPAALLTAEQREQPCSAQQKEERTAQDIATRSDKRTHLGGDRLIPLEERPDVAFPVIHGTYGEDGTLQGLLEMVDIPYVGCGVFGSAAGMDKDKMKMLFRSADLPVVDSLTFRRLDWDRTPERILDRIEARLGYPCFVKPANQGSSIGVSKASSRVELEQAMQLAAQYNGKIIVEQSVDCRELECSVLGNSEPVASVVGEVMMQHEFYDYEAKYLDNSSYTAVPADIPAGTAEEVQRMSVQAFLALDLSGLARVDFFLQRESGQVYINEVNTLPSFTPQCMYPKLCAASGLPYPQLLDRLIELAIERHADRSRNRSCL